VDADKMHRPEKNELKELVVRTLSMEGSKPK
jgi:hypothetical protein